MKIIDLKDIIPDKENVDAYLTFRFIEDWCTEHIQGGRWRFDHSAMINVCGIDIPGRIFFWNDEDAIAFRMKYRVTRPTKPT